MRDHLKMRNSSVKRTSKVHVKEPRNERGFTLIEMAIVMMLAGIALVAGLQLYDHYRKHEQIVETGSNIALTTKAVSDFRARFGRYPCPASLTAARGTPDYGREGDCNPNSLARDLATAGDEAPADNPTPGTFANGYYVEQSARTIDSDFDGTNDIRPLVVRGSIPFRDLNLPENYAYDGYGQRLSYAVTERLAVQDTFNPAHGGINIIDDQGSPQSLLEVPDSGLFVVYSHGMDGQGSYSREGERIENCPSGSDLESKNCDVSSASAEYVHVSRETPEGNTQFDDQLSYYSGADDSLWEVAEEDPEDIILRQEGRVGINLKIASSALPDDSVAVSGDVRAGDKHITKRLCDINGTNCFNPEAIGGDVPEMECPPGQFVKRITAGAVVCDNISEIRCAAGLYMTGVNPDGTLKCSAPPVRCPSVNRTICGSPQALPQMNSGSYYTLTGGASRSQTYRCQTNGNWTSGPVSTSGVCSCNPLQTTTGSTGCGLGYTGTRPYTLTMQCPAGVWGAPVYTNPFNSDCTCVGRKEYRDLSCGAGFNEGIDREVNTYTCDGSNNLVPSGWVDDPTNASPCACVPKVITETGLTCAGGLSGTRSRTNTLSCPGASWSGWVYDESGCYCDSGKTRTRNVSCDAPQIGTKVEQDIMNCTSATTGSWANSWSVIDDSGCSTPPPTVCVWNPIGTPVQVVTQPSVPRAGKECACGTGTSGCFEYGDPNYLKYNLCQCE